MCPSAADNLELRYVVQQIRLESMNRYYLPLPKLNHSQLRFLKENLEGRGFTCRAEGHFLRASDGPATLTIDSAGLASSAGELLDALAPTIPALLSFPKEASGGPSTPPYFIVKRVKADLHEIQVFPRMEGLRTWSELRRMGLCGLTPDEKAVVSSLLSDTRGTIECVTDYVSESSSPMMLGKRQFYRSEIPIREFVSNLGTMDRPHSRRCYLPRKSVIRVNATRDLDARSALAGLGEWCFLNLDPKTSNSGD